MSTQTKTKDETENEHPGIRPHMKVEWKKYVDETIANEPGDARNYALLLLKQVSTVIRALDQGMAPIEVIKLIEPNTSYVMMSAILQSSIAFSVRGEEFRLWWNEWHDRTCPDDVPEVAVEQMSEAQKEAWDRRPRAIFKPWQINVKGKTLQLTGSFDPSEAITKTERYLANVNAAIKAINAGTATVSPEGAVTV